MRNRSGAHHGRRIGGGNGAPCDGFQWQPAGAGSIPVRVGLGRTWGSTAKVEDKAEQALARGIGARCDGDGRVAGCAIARLELEEGEKEKGNTAAQRGIRPATTTADKDALTENGRRRCPTHAYRGWLARGLARRAAR